MRGASGGVEGVPGAAVGCWEAARVAAVWGWEAARAAAVWGCIPGFNTHLGTSRQTGMLAGAWHMALHRCVHEQSGRTSQSAKHGTARRSTAHCKHLGGGEGGGGLGLGGGKGGLGLGGGIGEGGGGDGGGLA